MVLDFNSPNCSFTLSDLGEYNINIIFDNIDKFKKFAGDIAIKYDFDKVFKTSLFQITLCDKNTADIDSVLNTYNVIATTMLKNPLPEITKKQLKNELRLRGYEIKRTNRKNDDGTYYKISIFRKSSKYD